MGPCGGIRDSSGARGEGLEPSITGPEPVVLPITPPPNGWTTRLAEPVGPVGLRVQLGVVKPFEVIEADDPAQAHAYPLLQEVGNRRPPSDRRRLSGCGRGR